MSRDGKKARIKIDPTNDVLSGTLSQVINEAKLGIRSSLMELCDGMVHSLSTKGLYDLEKEFLISALRKISEGEEPNKAFYYTGGAGNKSKDPLATKMFCLFLVNQFIEKGDSVKKACQEAANAIPQIISQDKDNIMASHPSLLDGGYKGWDTLYKWYYEERNKQIENNGQL
jgi:hypothetical protein